MVARILKDLNNKMSSFEESVDELKILKESVLELNEQVSRQELDNTNALVKLKADLKDNKTKILAESASDVGKIIISKEELQELKDVAEKYKTQFNLYKQSYDKDVLEKVEENVAIKLKIQKIEFDCQTAQLLASNENYKKEVENLNVSLKRMSDELQSQKQLTADVARVQRPPENKV